MLPTITNIKSLRDIFTKLQCRLITLGIWERAANLFTIQRFAHETRACRRQICRNARINDIRNTFEGLDSLNEGRISWYGWNGKWVMESSVPVTPRMYNPFLMMCPFFLFCFNMADTLQSCLVWLEASSLFSRFPRFFFFVDYGLIYSCTVWPSKSEVGEEVSRYTGCRYIRGTFFRESILEARTNTKVGMRKCWLRLGYWVISNLKFSLDETRWRQKEMTETELSYFI